MHALSSGFLSFFPLAGLCLRRRGALKNPNFCCPPLSPPTAHLPRRSCGGSPGTHRGGRGGRGGRAAAPRRQSPGMSCARFLFFTCRLVVGWSGRRSVARKKIQRALQFFFCLRFPVVPGFLVRPVGCRLVSLALRARGLFFCCASRRRPSRPRPAAWDGSSSSSSSSQQQQP